MSFGCHLPIGGAGRSPCASVREVRSPFWTCPPRQNARQIWVDASFDLTLLGFWTMSKVIEAEQDKRLTAVQCGVAVDHGD